MKSSGFAKPLVAVIVLLTLVATLGSMALPALAREASGVPFIEVQPADALPNGAPSELAFVEPEVTLPVDEVEEDTPEEATDPDAVLPDEEDAAPEELPPPTTEPPYDLSDIAPYPVPAGFQVLEAWNDGDNTMRATIYAATNGDPAALVAYLRVDHGDWTQVPIGDVLGVDPTRQWLLEQPAHPYCLWIEYYDKGFERRELELETGLVGPQFIVTETPFCDAFPDPYA